MGLRLLSLLLLLVPMTQGCGTVLYGTRQEISITSDPSEATATIGDVTVTTPATVSLRRRTDHTVRVTKDGYEEGQAQINRHLNGWTTLLGNAPWLLLPGGYVTTVLVDLVAGGGWTLEPDSVHVILEQKKEEN